MVIFYVGLERKVAENWNSLTADSGGIDILFFIIIVILWDVGRKHLPFHGVLSEALKHLLHSLEEGCQC